jgi:predicted HAD superfamily phosphohydrolase
VYYRERGEAMNDTLDLLVIQDQDLKDKINEQISLLMQSLVSFITFSYLVGKSEENEEHRQKLLDFMKFSMPDLSEKEIEENLDIQKALESFKNSTLRSLIQIVMIVAQNPEKIKVLEGFSHLMDEYVDLVINEDSIDDDTKLKILESVRAANKIVSA